MLNKIITKAKSLFSSSDETIKNFESDDKPSKTDYRQKHIDIMTEFCDVLDASLDIRTQCKSDRTFALERGGQWSWDEQGAFDNRPKVESNKILSAIKDAMSDMLNNSISTSFTPTKTGNDELADTVSSMFRADKKNGYIESVKNAMLEADAGGVGAYRIIVSNDKYALNTEHKRMYFEPIHDADHSVFWYSDGRKADKSDASGCIVISTMSRKAFKEKYDREPCDWDVRTYSSSWCWVSNNSVDIANVYEYEDVDCERVFFEMPEIEGSRIEREADDYDKDVEEQATLQAQGYIEVERVKVKERKVRHYIADGQGILEDCGYINGDVIPVVMLYGMRWYINGVERYAGRVRVCRDMMVLYNMMLSNLQEMVCAFGSEKYILTPQQIAGHDRTWQNDPIDNYAYLLLNGVDDGSGGKVVPPLQKTTPPQIPPALAALLQVAGQDVMQLAGNGANTEQIIANASGKMMEIARATIDKGNALLIDNVKDSELMCARIWLSIAKEIYTEDDREVKTVSADGKNGVAVINKPYSPKPGVIKYEADLLESDFDLDVVIGPATQSARDATANNLLAVMRSGALTPDMMQVVAIQFIQTLDGEGLVELKKYFRKKLVELGVIEPNDEEAKAMQEAANEPNPQSEYMLAEAARAETEAMLNAAKIDETKAKTEKLHAETMQKMQEMQLSNQQLVAVVNQLAQLMQQYTPQALPAYEQTEIAPHIQDFAQLPENQQGAALNQFSNTEPPTDLASNTQQGV